MDKKKKIIISAVAAVLIIAAGFAVWYVSGRNGTEAPAEDRETEESVQDEAADEKGEENEEAGDEETGDEAAAPSRDESDSYPRPEGTSVVSDPENITALVNKSNFLPEGWEPSDLVSVGGGQYLRAEAASALSSLREAASADGYTFNVISGYRTKETQISLYSGYVAQDPEGAKYLSAYPRSSEHEMGLAMDISPDWSLHYDLLETGLGRWMTAHAHEYGWILRYPEGKTDVTGYVFEAWHYRYVGKELAAEIKSSGLTLEEYYGSK